MQKSASGTRIVQLRFAADGTAPERAAATNRNEPGVAAAPRRWANVWTFGDLDGDSSLELANREFRTGLFGVWDRDRNGTISQAEFNEWNRNWF